MSQNQLSLSQNIATSFQNKIHVPTPKIPRPKQMGPRQRRRCPLGREDPCPGPGRPGSSSRVATHKLAAPPAKQVELAKRASTVRRSAIQRASPKNAPVTMMAASSERPCGKASGLAATTQNSQPVGLERQGPPRRGPPVAVIKAPRWPRQEVLSKRQPRGFVPRGTPRGGPERSAEEPWRKPRGGLCRGPARSAKDPQTPKTTAQKARPR